MSKQLNIKKVYIDSRYRTNDSVSDTDFRFDLKQCIDLPDNCVCYIDDVQIPHTWYSVEDYNNKLYMQVFSNGLSADRWFYIVPLTPGNHNGTSLATNIQDMLRLYFPSYNFGANYSASKGNITINSSSQLFRIVSDRELQGWPSSTVCKNNLNEHVPFNQYDLKSANSILRNTEIALSFGNTFTSQFIDLLNTHSIFIHSPNIGSFETLGPRGESTIIKKNTSFLEFWLSNN